MEQKFDQLIDLLNNTPVNLLVWVQKPGVVHDVDKAAKVFFSELARVEGPEKCILVNGTYLDEDFDAKTLRENLCKNWWTIGDEFKFVQSEKNIFVSLNKKDFVTNLRRKLFKAATSATKSQQTPRTSGKYSYFKQIVETQKERIATLCQRYTNEIQSIDEKLSTFQLRISECNATIYQWETETNNILNCGFAQNPLRYIKAAFVHYTGLSQCRKTKQVLKGTTALWKEAQAERTQANKNQHIVMEAAREFQHFCSLLGMECF